MIEIKVRKDANGCLVPVSQVDLDLVKDLKIGQAYSVSLTQQSERSILHHRLFFSGLLELTLEYWEPVGGALTPKEVDISRYMAKALESHYAGITGAIKTLLKKVARKRAENYPAQNKDKKALLIWLKDEIGHYDEVRTPRGIVYIYKSISFNSMSQEDFNTFYKQCFDVCWRVCLQKAFSGNQEHCQKIIDELLQMG